MKLTDQEVNKIIAEFMGVGVNFGMSLETPCRFCEEYDSPLYTESLDALVPVWEKLNVANWQMFMGDKHSLIQFVNKPTIVSWDDNDTSDPMFDKVQISSAYATAKAILELKGGE